MSIIVKGRFILSPLVKLQTDTQHIKLDLKDNETVFDQIYLDHYAGLHQYAFTITGDYMVAEEMVHQLFLKILEKNEPIVVHTSLKAYLYRAVHNECLNYLKHQKVKQAHQNNVMSVVSNEIENASGKIQYQQLEARLRAAINDLPEQCRIVFQLSRFEELKYKEIAAQLGISVKTVENQIAKALKRLRVQLAEYLPLIFWILINLLS